MPTLFLPEIETKRSPVLARDLARLVVKETKMPGEENLNTLLASMSPSLSSERYVFLTGLDDSRTHARLRPMMTFQEKEGATWIVTESQAAELGHEGVFRSRLITLNVHSSLDAVGFLARIATELAQAGISVNAVSAFYHDHLFVPDTKAHEAMSILRGLSERAYNDSRGSLHP